MSETTEVPWDIQVQGRAAGLWRRIRTQRNTLAGKSFTKPLLAGTARQALGRHMDVLAGVSARPIARTVGGGSHKVGVG